MMKMRSSMKQEKQRAITECRKEAEINKQKAIAETKKKQWCANCEKEAIFYCCWNTSYCDYPCQQSHWGVHMSSCAQNNQEQSEQDISKPEAVDPQHFPDDSSMMVDNHWHSGSHPDHDHQPRHQNRGRSGPGVPSSLTWMRFNMQFRCRDKEHQLYSPKHHSLTFKIQLLKWNFQLIHSTFPLLVLSKLLFTLSSAYLIIYLLWKILFLSLPYIVYINEYRNLTYFYTEFF